MAVRKIVDAGMYLTSLSFRPVLFEAVRSPARRIHSYIIEKAHDVEAWASQYLPLRTWQIERDLESRRLSKEKLFSA
jgi:hypothetical protein